MQIGRVERFLKEQIAERGAIHLSLIDPEAQPAARAAKLGKALEKAGTSAIMIGGSTLASRELLDRTVLALKEAVKIPLILFPNDIAGISRHADAIFFMSLLNSSNPYYITGAQALGASLVKRYGLEAIPMGYIIVGEGGAAGFVGQANPIPYNKPDLAALYALAAQYLGMRFVYLEAGSGARRPVPATIVAEVKSQIRIPLIVGGGIRDGKAAEKLVRAGADVVVVGTLLEAGALKRVKAIIKAMLNARKMRRMGRPHHKGVKA